MHSTQTIVIGGGQAGLAVSRCLADAGLDHVVLERGRLGESWRSERWDSLRLLTPNWTINLPGFAYDGDDPDGFLDARSYVGMLERYGRSFAVPLQEQTTVEAVSWDGERYTVRTDQGIWIAANLVVATGHCMQPHVPSMAAALAPSIDQLTPDRYRRPDQLADGGVLVVGASATGLQLAEELARSGRQVVLATGEHSRVPRTYRGLDIFRWLDASGLLHDRLDDHPRPARASGTPSLQLVGSDERRDLDLGTCRSAGVVVAGRLTGADRTSVAFGADLRGSVDRSQERMHRTLDRIDRAITEQGLALEVDAPNRPAALTLDEPLPSLDLARQGISTVLWATGFSRRYPWLPEAALDRSGQICHTNGIGCLPGLYVVGLRFQRHRSSNFIGGVGRDAEFVVDHLAGRSVRHEEVAA